MTDLQIPKSACVGIGWPALPTARAAVILALHHQFERSEWWPPERLLEVQLRQIEMVLAHAAKTVPFYRERLWSVAHLRPGELTLEMLRGLPILRRRDLQEAGPALVSQRPPKEHGPVFDIRTSGSTGRPVALKATAITTLFHRAANLRYHAWYGRDFAAKLACIRQTDKPGERDQAKAGDASRQAAWISTYPSGPMVFLPVKSPIGEQLDWLVRNDPDYLLTYPTNLAALLRRSEETGVRPAALRAVCTQSEALDLAVRTACERVWGIPITDAYSAMEFGPIAFQCPEHPHYHVQCENVLVEVLSEDGAPCGPGECGRLVVTSLHNFASPLIRYEIGDYAEVGEPCPCRRGLPVLKRILGRVRNMATFPNGEQFWPSFGSMYITDVAPIRQFQCVQKSLDHMEARLVTARELSPEEEDKVREEILSSLGHPFEVTLVYCDEIPRNAGGKFEEFQSELDPVRTRQVGAMRESKHSA